MHCVAWARLILAGVSDVLFSAVSFNGLDFESRRSGAFGSLWSVFEQPHVHYTSGSGAWRDWGSTVYALEHRHYSRELYNRSDESSGAGAAYERRQVAQAANALQYAIQHLRASVAADKLGSTNFHLVYTSCWNDAQLTTERQRAWREHLAKELVRNGIRMHLLNVWSAATTGAVMRAADGPLPNFVPQAFDRNAIYGYNVELGIRADHRNAFRFDSQLLTSLALRSGGAVLGLTEFARTADTAGSLANRITASVAAPADAPSENIVCLQCECRPTGPLRFDRVSRTSEVIPFADLLVQMKCNACAA